jgi:F420-dependent oxidoreductase-like protein
MLRVGVKLSGQGTTAEELRAVWQIADAAGFDHCWNFDHFAALGGDPELDVFEAWTMLGAMAEATARVRIGCMVTGNTYRHPGVLAKMAVTVDHLSGGRLEFGLGAAWAELEHDMLALEFGTVGQRIDRLEEACRMVKLLWTEERSDFGGRHYRLAKAIANPKPVQKPHPPIWIGGSGERKTLRVVAQQPTSGTRRAARRPRCSVSRACSTGTARTSAATRPRSAAPSSSASTAMPRARSGRCSPTSRSASTT